MKAHIEFSAFHKNNKAPNIKRCLATTETCKTLTRGLKRKYHLEINLESSKWVDMLLFNKLEQLLNLAQESSAWILYTSHLRNLSSSERVLILYGPITAKMPQFNS